MQINVHDIIKPTARHKNALCSYLQDTFLKKDSLVKVYKICVSSRTTFCTLFGAICLMNKIKSMMKTCVECGSSCHAHLDGDKGKKSKGKDTNDPTINKYEKKSTCKNTSNSSQTRKNGCGNYQINKGYNLHGTLTPPIQKLSHHLSDDRTIFIATLIITSKILFDYTYTTSDWSNITKIQPALLNDLERYVLFLLNYRIKLSNNDIVNGMKAFEKKSQCKISFDKENGMRNLVRWMIKMLGCNN